MSTLPRCSPEAQGASSEGILAFIDGVEAAGLELHSLMVLRRGAVVAEGWWTPYGPDVPHVLYSLSKSFASTAAGFAVTEGRFALDDAVISFFPDDLPAEVSDNLRAMRVRDLLTMSTGHTTEPVVRTAPEGNWPRQFPAATVEKKPGTHFLYNSAATYMVSAIVEKTTGQRLLDYLTPRLLEPLGITGAIWETDPRGVAIGGWGLNVKTEDIARFGQLYLQKGVWNGVRLLPEEWIDQATSKQVSNGSGPNNDWAQGYGFQFWRCRHGAYRGDGAFGQFCIVMPKQEAVVAITSGVGDMGAVLNLVWQHLLPAMKNKSELPENPAAHDRLTARLAGLAIPAPQGAASSPVAARVSGGTYRFGANDLRIASVTLDFAGDSCHLTFTDADGATHSVDGGLGRWQNGTTTFLRRNVWPILPPRDTCRSALYGAWPDANTLVCKLCLYETPFGPTLTFRFDGMDRLTLDVRGSIGFGPTERPLLEGTRQ